MKTAIFSLAIAISALIFSIFQFEQYQKFTLAAQYQFKKLDSELKSGLEAFHTTTNTLKQQEQAILSRTQHNAWKISEIQYLINLAQTCLKGTRDIKTAIDLLTLAEKNVQTVNDPTLHALQEALNNDLTALKNVSLPNLSALWSEITLLIEQSTTLPLRDTLLQKQDPSRSFNSASAKHNSWKQTLSASIQEIMALVKVRHHAKPLEPLLSETQQAIIKENLRLLLEQIRFAILITETTIYRQAIQDAEQWLTEYYDDIVEVKNILNTLTTLKKINLRPELPILSSVEQCNTLG